MGGKGSGGYRKGGPPKHNPVVDGNNPRNVDAEANHWSIELGKRLMHMEPPDYSDPDAIIERFEEYLAICDELHMRPLMQGTAMALGMNREMFSGIVHGRYTKWKNITPESIHAMQKCHDFLQLNWENQLSTEKGNPVKWIFLGKNHFGYRDQSERVVAHVDARPQLPDSKDVGRKYAALVGRDGDEGEQTYELPEETR